MEQITELSFIIVNYNAGELLERCVKSIIGTVRCNYEIIIFDNASSDDSLDKIKSISDSRIKIIENSKNIGFAKANNEAVKKASGRFLHFLNPDTELNDSGINNDYTMIFSQKEGTVYLNMIEERDGERKHKRQRIPLLKNYFYSVFEKRKIMYWYTGCSLIIAREDFEKTGGWPEDYFMYSEDLDFFYTAANKGLKFVELSSAVLHMGKGCTEKIWNEYERRLKVKKSFKKFFIKYNRKFEYYIVSVILLMFLLIFRKKEFLIELKTFFKVG